MKIIINFIAKIITYLECNMPQCKENSHHFPIRCSSGLGNYMAISVESDSPCQCGCYSNFYEYTNEERKRVIKYLGEK